MPLPAATRLGAYEILTPLGAGGMGEVYRARDTRLGRDVAIKVLPQHLSTRADVRARFEREARTISTLNHPHICVLHDVGREGDTDFLVMELLEGETLEARLRRGALPVAETLRLGGQIADALAQAHRAGVVHRDLKPGNVMLTRAGAKLMDFGLARPSGVGVASDPAMTHSPTVAGPLTTEGTIVGTFVYMAPEILEGREADARSDLWALGCMLYEMATGARAFAGGSPASLIAAILDREPRPMAELQPVTPPALERVVRHCLEKSPDARMQSAADLAFTLGLIGGAATAAAPAAPPAGSQRPRAAAWITLGVAALALAGAAFLVGRMSTRPAERSLRVMPLTHGGRDAEPAVSPDGRLVAFRALRPGGPGIWLMDVNTRSETRLTNAFDHLPRFSRDGGTIYFTRQTGAHFALWRVPAIGGEPRLVIDNGFDADCSPDGTRLAYIAEGESAGTLRLMTVRVDGSDPRELWTLTDAVLASPRWSPDGAHVATNRSGSQNSANAIVVVEAASGRVRQFPSPHLASLSSTAWDGTGRGLLVAEGENVVAAQTNGQGQLLRLDTRTGAFTALGWLPSMPIVLDLLGDGRMVISTAQSRINLCEVPTGARSVSEGRWLTEGSAADRQPVYSPDGEWIMFSSNRGGALDLWEVSRRTGELRRVTDDPASDWDPAYTRDGQAIFWSSDRSRAFEIWTAQRNGRAPRQVSNDSLDAENPAPMPDGRSVVYSSSKPGGAGLWRVPLDGGVGERILPGSTLIPDLSPDGRMISTITDIGTPTPKLAVFDVERGEPLPRTIPLRFSTQGDVVPGRSRWTPDGKAVLYLTRTPNGRIVLLRAGVDTWRHEGADPDTLFPVGNEIVETFGISPDGRHVTVAVVEFLSGLTLVDGIRGIVPPAPRSGGR